MHGVNGLSKPPKHTAVEGNRGKTYQNPREQPEDGGEEAERFGRLESSAGATVPDKSPIPNATAAEPVDHVNQKTKCSKPGQGQDDVDCACESARRQIKMQTEGSSFYILGQE